MLALHGAGLRAREERPAEVGEAADAEEQDRHQAGQPGVGVRADDQQQQAGKREHRSDGGDPPEPERAPRPAHYTPSTSRTFVRDAPRRIGLIASYSSDVQ